MFGTQWSYMVYFGMASSSNHQMTVFIFQVQKSQSAFSYEMFFFMSSQDSLRACWALNTSRISGCKTKLRKTTFYCVLTFAAIANIIVYNCKSKSVKPFLQIFPLDRNQISGDDLIFCGRYHRENCVCVAWIFFFFFFGISSSLASRSSLSHLQFSPSSSTFHSLNQTFWVRKWL